MTHSEATEAAKSGIDLNDSLSLNSFLKETSTHLSYLIRLHIK